VEADPKQELRAERSRLRKVADKLGWKLVGGLTLEIRCERSILIGPRTVTIRGRVPVPVPVEMTPAGGERALAPLVDPTIGQFKHAMERAAAKILSEPDDGGEKHVYERSSFFSALEDARRGLVHTYQTLENRRVDEKVEADLGLRFYLDGLPGQSRTFEYFVGPTNSGKTHAAIELLRAANSGVYLAPLRLLALEVYERMNDLGIATSLVTGEERVLHPHARHVSSTVEMIDLSRALDVAVVDEAQLLEDSQRGWAWTLAIAGVRAKHVVLCGSEEGLRAAQRLTQRLGIPLGVRRFERKNPLQVVPAIPLAALRPGDAVVAFTRNGVVELQGQIARLGFSSAAIYGSLSPAVRRREADRFRSGAADVLVATDAIGLGLNLPIRRIVFASVEKYDGVSMRLLTPQEIRQIAGRAGRYGIHEEGLVSALEPRDVLILRKSIELHALAPSDAPIWISPTDEHLRRLAIILGTTRVSRLLQFFQTRVLRDDDGGVRIADLTDTIEVSVALEFSAEFLELPLEVRCTYSRAPVTTRGTSLAILAHWGAQHAHDGIVDGSELVADGKTPRDRLLLYEDRSRLATLYLWLAQRFPDVYTNRDEITTIREQIDSDIQHTLLERGGRAKRTRPQGKPMHKSPRFRKSRLPR